MTAEELLLELRDIQAPPAPEWWLIAPAYLIGIVIIIVLFLAFVLLRRNKNKNRLVNQASHDLQQIKTSHQRDGDNHLLALNLSKWLKQVSILAFPELQPASLSGQCWLNFLDQSNKTVSFSKGAGLLFAGSVYCRAPQFDPIETIDLCERWLLGIRPQLLAHGQA